MTDFEQRRPEDGPMRFNDDWSGLFLRGDTCFGLAMSLREILKELPQSSAGQASYFRRDVEYLARMLAATNHSVQDQVPTQIMKGFLDCFVKCQGEWKEDKQRDPQP